MIAGVEKNQNQTSLYALISSGPFSHIGDVLDGAGVDENMAVLGVVNLDASVPKE